EWDIGARGLTLQADTTHPVLWLHSSCSDAGIELRISRQQGGFLFAAASCPIVGEDEAEIAVYTSDDARLETTDLLPSPAAGHASGVSRFVLRRSQEAKSDPQIVGSFRISAVSGDGYAEQSVVWPPAQKRHGVVGELSLSLGDFSYTEAINNVAFESLSVV